MTTCLGKSCSFGLPRVPFVNCCQYMYLVVSLLILRAGRGIWLYQFLIIAYLFTFQPIRTCLMHMQICRMTIGHVSFRWTCIALHSVFKQSSLQEFLVSKVLYTSKLDNWNQLLTATLNNHLIISKCHKAFTKHKTMQVQASNQPLRGVGGECKFLLFWNGMYVREKDNLEGKMCHANSENCPKSGCICIPYTCPLLTGLEELDISNGQTLC